MVVVGSSRSSPRAPADWTGARPASAFQERRSACCSGWLARPERFTENSWKQVEHARALLEHEPPVHVGLGGAKLGIEEDLALDLRVGEADRHVRTALPRAEVPWTRPVVVDHGEAPVRARSASADAANSFMARPASLEGSDLGRPEAGLATLSASGARPRAPRRPRSPRRARSSRAARAHRSR